MYGNLFVNTQISANLRNKLQEYTQSPDKITQKYERIHSFTKRTVRSFRKFEVRVACYKILKEKLKLMAYFGLSILVSTCTYISGRC